MGCIRPGHRRRPGFFNIFHRFIHISAKIGGFPGGFWGKTGDRFPLQGGRGGVRPFQRPQQSPGGVPKDRLALRRLEGRTLFSAGTGLRRRLGWGKGHRGVARLPPGGRRAPHSRPRQRPGARGGTSPQSWPGGRSHPPGWPSPGAGARSRETCPPFSGSHRPAPGRP